jgi:hypothetical protein
LGFSPGTPASSTTKTGRHDIAEILLKVALNTKNQNQIENIRQNYPTIKRFQNYIYVQWTFIKISNRKKWVIG